MALADYMLCAKCDSKAFYDADVNWEYFNGQAAALCDDCAKNHELVIVPRKTELNEFTQFEATAQQEGQE